MYIPLGKTYDRQALQDLGFDLNTVRPSRVLWEHGFLEIECPPHLKCETINSGVLYYSIKYKDLTIMSGYIASNDADAVMVFHEENIAIAKADLDEISAKRYKNADAYPHPATFFFSSGNTDQKDFNSAVTHPASIPAPGI